MRIEALRLYDIPSVDDRADWGGFGTSFFAGELCEITRDELGWIHVRIGKKDPERPGQVIWRARRFAFPPQMVKFTEYESDSATVVELGEKRKAASAARR